MQPLHLRLAELDGALDAAQDVLEQVLYHVVVARLVRESSPSDTAEADRQLEAVLARLSGLVVPTSPDLSEFSHGRHSISTVLTHLVRYAPEPYRTMLADHRDRLLRISSELEDGPAGRAAQERRESDPLDRLLDDVAYRVARGALASSASPTLGAFLGR